MTGNRKGLYIATYCVWTTKNIYLNVDTITLYHKLKGITNIDIYNFSFLAIPIITLHTLHILYIIKLVTKNK